MNINEIKPNPNNPRLIKDDKFKQLVKSIQDFPQMLELRPIVVNDDNIVLGGNMRLKACKEAGLKEVPVIKASSLTEEQQKEFIVKDNLGFGEWNWDVLANEWDAEKLTEWGMDIPDFKVADAVEDDYEIPEEIKTDIVLGDLFEIEQHRLLCGDSTDSDDVARLMDGQKADMVFTDPPYGVEWQNNAVKRFDVLLNDDKILDVAPIIELFLKEGRAAIIWTAQSVYPEWRKQFESVYKSTVIWNKGGGGKGDLKGDFMPTYEMALYCTKGRFVFSKSPRPSAVWEFKKDGMNEYKHPTQKPVGLAAYGLEYLSFEQDLVLDLFLGSGTTMVAAHQLNRKCYGMELDPKYCQVIVDRMLKLDPSLEIKKNGKPYICNETVING